MTVAAAWTTAPRPARWKRTPQNYDCGRIKPERRDDTQVVDGQLIMVGRPPIDFLFLSGINAPLLSRSERRLTRPELSDAGHRLRTPSRPRGPGLPNAGTRRLYFTPGFVRHGSASKSACGPAAPGMWPSRPRLGGGRQRRPKTAAGGCPTFTKDSRGRLSHIFAAKLRAKFPLPAADGYTASRKNHR